MSKNAAVDVESEGETLEDLEQEWSATQAEAEYQANQPDPDEVERARKLAEKMNASFLWAVNRTQCPHVAIDELVDREKGNEAFEPLAEKWGGEVPPWLEAMQPYIAAGVYMGTTIITARQAEAAVIEQAERRHQQEQGARDGEEPQQ